jgi:hypothetical protein
MNKNDIKGRGILQDPNAESAHPILPAFLARPKDKPVYHGFPVVQESETDGWHYGAITEYNSEEEMTEGDGYVIAPDGSRAGIVWDLESNEFYEIFPPDEGRWGVYGVRFTRAVKSVEDIVYNFRKILPKLKEQYEKVKGMRLTST